MSLHVNFLKCSVINYIRKATFVFRCSSHSVALNNSLSLVIYLKWFSEFSLLSTCNFLETLIDRKKNHYETVGNKVSFNTNFFCSARIAQINMLSNISGKNHSGKRTFFEYFIFCKLKSTLKILNMFLSFCIHNIS